MQTRAPKAAFKSGWIMVQDYGSSIMLAILVAVLRRGTERRARGTQPKFLGLFTVIQGAAQ